MLNKELENVSDYFKANQLKLNPKKTKMIYFCKKSSKLDPNQAMVKLDGVRLDFEHDATFLGIQIDSHLNWDKHCIKVANTISRNNSLINRVKKLLPPSSLKLLYYSFIQPHLQYGLAVWGGCTGQNKNRIISFQKRAIQTITKSYYSAHTEPRLKKTGLLKFEDLYEQQCLTLTHDCVYGNAPGQIEQMIQKEQDGSRFNLRTHAQNPLNLKVLVSKSRLSSGSFAIKGPAFWNNINNELKQIPKKKVFKNTVKRQMLEKYQHTTHCNNPRCTDRRHHQSQD